MREDNGISLPSLKVKTFFTLFLKKREVELRNGSYIHWSMHMVVHSIYYINGTYITYNGVCRDHSQFTVQSWYIQSGWESTASPGEHTRDKVSLGDSQLLGEARSCGLGRLRVCRNSWKEGTLLSFSYLCVSFLVLVLWLFMVLCLLSV